MLTQHASQRRHGRDQQALAARMHVVSGLAALEHARCAWRELWCRTPDATPFQSPAWVLAWARHFAPDRTHAIVAHDGGRLDAFLPFFTWDGRLLLAGTGPSDYGDGLFGQSDAPLASAVLERLCGAARELGCECVDLQQLRAGSRLLESHAPTGWRSETSAGVACPVAPINGGDGTDAVSPHWRKNAARAARVLRREFALEAACAGQHEWHAAAATLERLHRLRWGPRDDSHAFDDPLMRTFLHAVIPELGSDGLLRLQRLRIDGEDAALVFAMGTPHAHYFYMSGFDPRWSRYSTGLVTILAAMRAAAQEQARQFHFLRGGEAYKYHLGATDQPTFRRILRPRTRGH